MSTQANQRQDATIPASIPNTPALIPSNSLNPSPAFSTVLKSPAVSEFLLEYPFEKAAADKQAIPECWSHRGASASFPENTIASFVEACKARTDGIETDIHMTTDNVLVMFHDPELGRTTDGKGRIDKLPWKGVLEHVRTRAEPFQPIPQFNQVIDILLQPENSYVKLNLDLKVENDPVRLFGLIKSVVESYDGWQEKLASRIILGIWHPKFIVPAATILPYLPRYAISMDVVQCRKHFFTSCHGFSIMYPALASSEGAKFRKECNEAGKKVCCWTVNEMEEMRQCVRWGVSSVITDKPDVWNKVRRQIETDRAKALKPTLSTYILPFMRKKNWWFEYQRLAREETEYLEREAGTFNIPIPKIEMRIASASYE
ncbi:hypothetical protein L204_105965 [Cryptococcus depauperatus]|nr:glycerophosphodiesterase [Cryptococcus depauperatus CBS 7855]